MKGLRWLWPVLLIGSIIFAAGPNGAWLSAQFVAPVPAAWGWLGALLLGLAVFGGIKLAVGGRRLGVAIAGVGGVTAVLVDAQYFGQAHGVLLAGVLGLFPTLLAVLAGVVEGVNATAQEEQAAVVAAQAQAAAAAEQAARLEWELREASRDRAAARRAEFGAVRAVVRAERTPEQDKRRSFGALAGQDAAFGAYVAGHPAATYREIAAELGCSTSTVSAIAARTNWRKNGHGWERAV